MRWGCQWFVTAALCVSAGVSAGVAQAEPHRRLAVTRLEFQGNLSEVGRLSLSERLVAGLAAAGFQVFAGTAVTEAIKRDAALDGCAKPDCRAKIAQALGAEYLVTGQIVVNHKNYEIMLELLNGRDGASLGQSREHCVLCGIQEAGDMMDRVASALRGFLATTGLTPAHVTVESRPPGAYVTVDGRAAGATPLSLDLPAGRHNLGFSADGFRPWLQTMEAQGGTTEIVSVELIFEPVPLGPPVQTVRRAAWGGLAAGVVAVVAGMVALSYNGKVVDCPPEKSGMKCHKDTGILAGVLLGAGTTVAAAGGLVLFVARDVEAPGPGQAQATTSWVVSARTTF